ncbi:MAG: Thiamin pyrophosphokinase, catalytic region [Clostridia bacterium 62_21]|nr:MAG: Thiamin pyrophosphokinase, catalytic region [Clostridia bacterium 62_21]
MAVIQGRARLDRRTKNLVRRLTPGDIAIINHAGIDRLAAEALVRARPRAVINAAASLSSDYPNPGPLIITQAGIPLLDAVGEAVFERLTEGEKIQVRGNAVYKAGVEVAAGELLTPAIIMRRMEEARSRVRDVLERFVDNTLTYARQEIGLIAGGVTIPAVQTPIWGRHVLVVVRGEDYRDDLRAIRSYIREIKPVLIGVDGGADALLEFGFRPDIVIGDMDSVSDRALRAAREIVVHAYPDGRAPGLERVEALGLKAHVFAAPGTSEDIAMLLAYEKGADLIVALGTHSNMFDFLEKGRPGMGSTFLVRLKVGAVLVDAKGVSRLYRRPLKARHVVEIVAAALLPVAAVISLSPATREIVRLLYIQLRLLLGI